MKNKRHQVKSRMYYYFWGAMAVAVVGGQIYVGLGYREMAEATKGDDIRVTCVAPFQSLSSQAADKNRSFEYD